MAPSRKRSAGAQASGSASKKPKSADGGLFFGGTRPLQEDDREGDDGEEQTYLYESDADEDAEYAESVTGARKRRAQKSKKKGGKAGGSKPTDSDFDSGDKCIIHYKKLGYKDDAVASKLGEEGHTKLSAKTISSRWLRLKKIVEEKEEERLDDELSDWHIGEDEKLRECFNAAEAKYELDLIKLKEKKWRDISAAMANVLGQKKYTPRACKERFESLEDGTALLPIEIDPNPEEREAMREARIVENQRVREEKKAADLWQLGEKDRKAAEKRAILEQKDRERKAERARKQAERDEDERIKAEQRAGLEERRAKQRAIEREIKANHKKKRTERKNADAMYMRLKGTKINGRRDMSLLGLGFDKDADTESDSDMEMADSFINDDEQDSDMPDLTDAEEDSAGESDDGEEDGDGESGSRTRGTRPSRKGKGKSKHTLRPRMPKVTLDTLANPRSIMTYNELAEVLASRNLRARGPNETHAQIVARIAAADAAETRNKIRELLAVYFDRSKGNHDTLVRRLQEHDAASSVAGKQGVTALDPEFKRDYEGYHGKFAFALEEDEA